MVCQDRWSLVTGSVTLKCRSFCKKCVVFQDRWSFMAVESQDRFHCSFTSRYRNHMILIKACLSLPEKNPWPIFLVCTANMSYLHFADRAVFNLYPNLLLGSLISGTTNTSQHRGSSRHNRLFMSFRDNRNRNKLCCFNYHSYRIKMDTCC